MHKIDSEDKYENTESGADEAYVRKVSPEREQIIEHNLGLQVISICLQKTLIDELKDLAKKNGISYQPYVRQLLTKHMRDVKHSRRRSIEQ